tara:strand:- start:72 stop:9053 length:8982 start_codon:yes stop_codon:yes gene_type:complete
MGTTAFDSSGNGYDGTLTNGPTYYLSNPYRNYTMEFDGVDDYVDMGHIPVINFQRTDNFTINCWVNVDGISGSSYEYNDFLGQMYGAGERGWYIQQHLTYLYLTIRAGSASNNYQLTVYPNGFSFTVGVWTHLSVIFTGTSGNITVSNVKFYINGTYYSPTAMNTNADSISSSYDFAQTDTSHGKFAIGARRWENSSSSYFPGQISDVRIYDYPLNAQEIYKIYKTGEVFGTEKLHYTFNQAGGNQVLDQSGNGYHGTATGGPTYQKVENPNLGSYLTVDSAERFNHSNGYLYPMYDISSKSHSFFCWMKLDENYTSGKHSNCIFSKVLNKNYVDMALSLNNGKLEFETKFNDNVDSSIIELYPTFLPNQWYHIGYSINYTESSTESINTKKTGILHFYVNGVMHNKYVSNNKRHTSSKNISIRTHNINNFHSSKLYIGKRGDSSLSTFNDSTFKGYLSDIRFYNTEITPMQVRELFFNRNDGTIINTELSGIKSNQLLFEKFDGTDILIGHWSLSSSNSRIIFDKSRDTTHNNNNGLLDSGISSIRYSGITGSIPLFDGSSNDQMKITCSAAITGIKSISFWIKPKSVTQKTLLFLKDDSTDTFIEINGIAQINTSNVSSPTTYVNTLTTATTLVVDKWYHIVITTATGITTDTSIYVSSKVSSDYYNGFIDDIRFYNIELTNQQINNLYYQQSTPQLPHNNELIGKWLLNGNFLDSSGYNNHGTLTGNEQFITGYNGNLAFKSNVDNSTINLGNFNNDIKSISMWLYFEKLDNTFLNLGYDVSLSSYGKINLNSLSSPSLYINGVKDSLSLTSSESTLELNKWHNVLFTSNAIYSSSSSSSISNIDYTLLPTQSVSAWTTLSTAPSGGSGWTTASGLTDRDDYVQNISLSTPFKFYNTNYSNLYVSTNGWINFVSTLSYQSDYTENVGDFQSRKLLAFLWDDLNPYNGGDIYYKYISTTNTNDTFVIVFMQVHEYGTSNDNSVEIRLHLNNGNTANIGKIELEYGLIKNTTDGIIGISNSAGSSNSLQKNDMYSNSSDLNLNTNQSIYSLNNIHNFEGKLITLVPYREVTTNTNTSSDWTQLGSDIDGEADDDEFGYSVSMSSDGTIVAIGARYNDGENTSNSGHVRVYQYSSGSWSQLGSDIDGEAANDNSGWSVSLSSDGTIVAIGASNNNGGGNSNSGHVRVYQYSSGNWSQLGSDIDGEAANDYSGRSLSLSSDGTIVAISAYYNDGVNGSNSGHVRVYQYSSGSWSQLGSDIDGEAAGDQSGFSVSMNSDGTIVAIGATGNDGTTGNTDDNRGHVRIYQYSGGSWSQLGSDIDGEAAGDQSGFSVSMNSDGTIVAIGAYYHSFLKGHVKIYEYTNSSWTQLGDDIYGEVNADYSGWSVSLSSDGTIIAIGEPARDGNGNTDSGRVRVYQFANNSWTQLGPDIDSGENSWDLSGQAVSLSSDGTIVAIGAPRNEGDGGYHVGHVRIYEYTNPDIILSNNSFKGAIQNVEFYNTILTDSQVKDIYKYGTHKDLVLHYKFDEGIGNIALDNSRNNYDGIMNGFAWDKIGSDIDGEDTADRSGWSISLSSDGTIIAIGALYNNGNGSNSGHVRVYQYSSGSWSQLGSDINGEATTDNSGCSVSLNSDGTIIAIGALYNDGNGTSSGHVRVYQYSSGSWSQLGSDIDGEAIADYSGHSVSLSSDGTIVAIGAYNNDGNGINSGHVRVYQYDSLKTTAETDQNSSNFGPIGWKRLGSDIDGEASDDGSGYSVSLNSDGTIVAIGAVYNDRDSNTDSGQVRVYQYSSGSWTQIGSDIDGEAAGDRSGYTVSLSSDGTIVAIGALYNDGNGTNSGHVRVYQYSSESWSQLGSDIDGEATNDNSGYSVSLNSDGTIVAIGARYNDNVNGTNSGHVRVYQYSGVSWVQLGSDIDGEAVDDFSGYSVSLSSDGTTVGIGAPYNDGNSTTDSGHVRVYNYKEPLYTSNYLEEKNKALIFNGTSNYLINSDIVKSGDTNFFGNTKWSISLWFKANNGLDGTPSNEVIINFGGCILLNWDHSVSEYRGSWRVQQSSWKIAQYTGSPTNNTWYHAVATFDSSVGLKAYLNGTHNVDASSSNAAIDTPTTNLLIGTRTITTDFFAGSVADVRIYNYVLSANQITDLYYQNKSHNINNLGYDNQYLTFSQKDIRNNNIINDETHIKRDNLALYYKFKDSSISDVKDYGNKLIPESQSYTYNSGVFKSNTTTTTITDSFLTNGKDGLNNNALKLDGTDDHITIDNTISFTAGGTISLWIQANYINENILQLTSDDDVYLQLTTDLKLKMTFDATTTDIYLYINGKVDGYLASGTILTSNNSIDPLIWNHIGVSFNNYNSGGTLSANEIKLGLIGDTISTTTVFNGAFDELKMFTTQLTNDEMYQLYFDKKSSPILHLPMQETSGSKLCNIGTSKIDVRKFPKFSTTQTQTLVPTSGDANDVFGSAIDLNDDFIIVGDHNEDANNKGTVYVFNNNGNNTWGSSNNENDKLRATSRVNNALFGTSVAISGNTIIVGAPGEDVTANATADDTGCVYVFTYSGSAWSQSQRLTASDAAAGDKFGTSVAISGNTFIVGAPNENTEAGQVYVFNYDSSTWSQNSILAASSRVTNAYFGNNISIFNNQIFISAYGEHQTAGSTADNTGCVYVFNYNGSSWYQTQRLTASDATADDKFGSSLCVSNDILLIGAPEENTEQGQVYIFNYDSSAKNWSQDTSNILQADSRADYVFFTYFGYSVGFSNNKIIVGAYKTGTNKGKIHEFYYNNSTKYIGPIIDGDADNDLFGQTLKVHNDKLIIGVPGDNSGEGAVYFYKADNTITAPSTDINPYFNKHCLNFNGTTDFFELRTPINLIRSVSLWINPSAVGNRILYYISSTIKIEINSSNQINAYGFTSPSIYINNKSETVSNSGSNNTGGTALTTNNWYHIVVFSSTAVASVINNSYIGHNNSDSTSILFQGHMSDFRVYDCQLSKPEIHKLYNYSNIYKSISY